MANGHYVTSMQWLHREGGQRLLARLANFFLAMLIGAVLFSLILLPVVALNYAVIYFERLDANVVILNAMTGVGYLITAADVLLFVFFVLMQIIRALRG